VYERAYNTFKENKLKEERVVLLETWLTFENESSPEPDSTAIEKVESMMPKSVKKRRRLMDENGEPGGWEEYFDYVFPDDEEEKPNLKLLAMAHQWKQKMAELQAKKDSE
jgi:crooked neck